MMDRYCVIGHPVAHSKSPWIHARFAELTGQALRYDALLAPLDGFADAVRRFQAEGGRGCNVTVPFKFEAAALASELTDRATLAGACNTLVLREDGSILGDNTDGAGWVRDIEQGAGFALAGRRVLLVGAGGAAAGLLGPVISARPARVMMVNRTVAKAEALVAAHQAWADEHGVQLACGTLDEAGEAHELVVNATASSLKEAAVPVRPDVLARGALACDLMYGPAARGFLDWAASHGAVPRDGLGMLVEQAAESFLRWRGVRPPTAAVLSQLRTLLEGAAPRA
ncbi:shikimate dehydrogenase [Ramlibacter rhizophilus]|uniref:Shikimate dehydrogenase (NADP(+)) n=1 Tax=Ramlibacter rhizophilus TaxID=1781167 RepID=A0A4Z0BQE6_9BURK|nr:shikimate dehydrogenase [Ramlibacter rhizophilus]TFZ01536.1 shikimate dehydrogenase [Ramlibacter rhizophilus]